MRLAGRGGGRTIGRKACHRSDLADLAVEEALGTEILLAMDMKRKPKIAVACLAGKLEVLGPEAEQQPVARDQIHRRRPEKGRDERIGRLIVDLARRPELADPALLHDRDPIAHPHRLDLIVRHVEGGRADPALELLQLVAGGGAALGIEVRQRLIEQKDVRLAHQGAGQRYPLPLTAGELARLAVEQMVDAEDRRGPLHLPLLRRPVILLRFEREGDVVGDGHMRVERVALEDHRDLAGAGGKPGHDPAADQDIAAGRRFEPADHPQQRRLAAPRGTEQDEELAIRAGQVDPVDGGDPVAELLRQIPGFDDCHGR